ncbi:hypothetical protein Tco_1029997 [Tanacetum coccineum]|uniref:Uncharacterized protein n=1 Tax=Tanacetum coccineum TaxID=301880 RepID=A0ABQ5G512_9ASTR
MFLNNLPPEWSKFVTDVKLVMDLHTTNFDQLHAYLEQHELHANEVCLLRERNQDPLAFVANQQMTPPHFNTYQSSYNNPQLQQYFDVPVFSLGDDPIACLNKAMTFLTAVASSRFPSTNNQLRTSSNPRNQATIQDGRVTVQQVQGRQGQSYSDTRVSNGQAVQTIIPNNAAFQTKDLDTYDSDCDDISNAKVVLMDNISNYGSDVISEAPHSETYLNDMENQSVHAMQDFEQTPAENVQDTHLQAQQDSMILSVIEQMSDHMINHVNNWEKANKEQNSESVTTELERYKERVKTLEQRLNIDLSSREKMIDSQMDDMIKEKLALKEQVDSLEQNISKQIKEKELSQSAQTVHMLTKPQAFYDNIHKQALGYQNPFYLRKAQQIKPTLYDGIVISDKHVAIPVIDDEEILILEEKSRSKMFEKAKDPEVISKNISHKPIDYEKLNRLSEDFGKRFTPQQEMDAEQAFWFCISNPTSKHSDASPVKIKAHKELPKVSLVNESLKKIKFHLARFDNVVNIRTTPDARIEGEWGFEHTKAVFNNEIIPFLKSLKDILNFSVDKQCLEIAKKELFLENDRLLQQIMSQDVLLTVMNSMSLRGEYVTMDGKRKETSSIQLNQEIFQKDESYNNQNALEIPEFFEKNDLKAQLQDKDSTICKLKDIIKSMRENSKEENVNYDYGEIETKNVELENSVAKLSYENERLCNEINHVKQVFKEQFDSIKKTHVHTKEHSDSLIDKLN